MRPKVWTGLDYRSSGDFNVHEISRKHIVEVANYYSEEAGRLLAKLNGLKETEHTKKIEDVTENLHLSQNMCDLIIEIANENKEAPRYDFYQMKRKHDDHVYALSITSIRDDEIKIEVVAAHPVTLLSRIDNNVLTSAKIELGKYNLRGVGQSMSILSTMKSLKQHKKVKSLSAFAENPYSGENFRPCYS